MRQLFLLFSIWLWYVMYVVYFYLCCGFCFFGGSAGAKESGFYVFPIPGQLVTRCHLHGEFNEVEDI